MDKSLVVPEEKHGQTRYRLFETVRQYAADRLLESGEVPPWRVRHRAYFLALAEQTEPELTGAHQAEWLERLEVEHDNLRTALESAAGEPEGAEVGLRLSGALWRFWHVRGHLSEGRVRLERALRHETAQYRTKARADTLNGAGNIAKQQGDYAAAATLFEESLSIRRELGDRLGVARTLGNLGIVAQEQGDLAAGRTLQEESLTISRELGDRWGVGNMLDNLGVTAYCAGANAAARALHEESLTILRELGHHWGVANTLSNLGDVANQEGDYVAAHAFEEESLAGFRELGHRGGIAEALEGIAAAAGGLGCEERAARLWGAAEVLREASVAPMPPVYRDTFERYVVAARSALGEEAFAAAWQAGRALTMEEAIDLALGETDG